MALEFKVPSMVCSGCVDKITQEITTNFPNSNVNINLDTKMVTVETEASKDAVTQVIVAAGHTVE